MYLHESFPAGIYGNIEIQKFCSSGPFPELYQMVSPVGNFNYNILHCFGDPFTPLKLNGYSC